MRLIVQRVTSANVKVSREEVGEIHNGAFILVGIKKRDSRKNADYLVRKLLKLRIMSDGNGKINVSLVDAKAHILAVSQFTLYANTKDGNRPSFLDAEEPEKARELYDYFINKLKNSGLTIETGSFGEYMNISAELDGPVTIILEN